MPMPNPSLVQTPQAQQTLAITATFTAEPIEEFLSFWMEKLNFPSKIEFAPYNQLFQQLLDPFSLLSQNRHGINIVLLRFEDWQRFSRNKGESEAESLEAIRHNLQELVTALRVATERSAIPYLVTVCPPSPSLAANPSYYSQLQTLESFMLGELREIPGLYLLTTEDIQTIYPVADYYDSKLDQLGHIPFTPAFFSALSTILARKIYALKSAPHKVIVLDCDNTLWKGVVGEDGVNGIEISPVWQSLQQFMVAQQKAGMLLCLCSKNNEADALEVFEQRQDMVLKLDHIVTHRINWLPKSENIKSLAAELNLGMDSFIFIDDNPMECAEVQANCPDVLTLRLPIEADMMQFLQNIWAFDRLKITQEDQQRTALYKQNIERHRFQQEASTIGDFLAGLALEVDISEPDAAQLSRVAQLTQRTNQFNFTTVRRSDTDVQQLNQNGLECRIVQVRDRFGDYGIVGVLIFSTQANLLEIDTFLLSCRVLGRGVEHQMLNYLGKIAQQRHLSHVQATYLPTKKNLPALNFLESIGADLKQATDKGFCFDFPAEMAATLTYEPGTGAPESPSETAPPATTSTATIAASTEKSALLTQIATALSLPENVLHQVELQRQTSQRSLEQPLVAPRSATEKRLVELWTQLLRVDAIGIRDDYFELGGTSLLAVEAIAQVEAIWGKKLPLTAMVEAPTIEQFARLIEPEEQSSERRSLVLLRQGSSKPPLFLVHDGDGETLLYRNLAKRLSSDHPVYGIQPHSRENCPILHTRIADMAAYYIEQIRSVQPEGPYLLGGMCAGGVISFEMARQLQLQGQSVALIALMDAADVEAPKRSLAGKRLNSFSQIWNQNAQSSFLSRIFSVVKQGWQKVFNLTTYVVGSRIQNTLTRLRMQLFRYYLDRNLPLPTFLQHISVRTVYLFAEAEYTPETQYQGEVVLLRATQGVDLEDEAYIDRYSDPLLGWGKRVTQEVVVYDMPGGHSSMLQEPNVEVMAEKLQAYIDTALAEPSAPTREVIAVR
jgi:FkbH-like protein